MNKEQIKSFTKIFFSGTILGFFIGFITFLIGLLNINIENTFQHIFQHIFPNLIFLVTLVNIIILIIFSNIKNKIKKDNYEDSEDSIFSKYEKTLVITQSLSTILVFTNVIFVASMIANPIILIPFVVNIVVGLWLETAHVNLIKLVQPTKDADPTTFDYNDKALDTLDECEIQLQGKVALKTNNKMVFVYVGFIVIGFFSGANNTFFISVWGIYISQALINLYYSLKLGDFKSI